MNPEALKALQQLQSDPAAMERLKAMQARAAGGVMASCPSTPSLATSSSAWSSSLQPVLRSSCHLCQRCAEDPPCPTAARPGLHA
jgi:hypothetical protein